MDDKKGLQPLRIYSFCPDTEEVRKSHKLDKVIPLTTDEERIEYLQNCMHCSRKEAIRQIDSIVGGTVTGYAVVHDDRLGEYDIFLHNGLGLDEGVEDEDEYEEDEENDEKESDFSVYILNVIYDCNGREITEEAIIFEEVIAKAREADKIYSLNIKKIICNHCHNAHIVESDETIRDQITDKLREHNYKMYIGDTLKDFTSAIERSGALHEYTPCTLSSRYHIFKSFVTYD